MAIYRVKNKKTGDKRVVITRTKAGAINFAASADYEAEVIRGGELLKESKLGTACDDLTEKEPGLEGTQPLPMKNQQAEEIKSAQAKTANTGAVAGKPATSAPLSTQKAVGAK